MVFVFVVFWIEKNNETIMLRPENRWYTIENAISAESDIYSFITKDIYVVLGSLEDDGTLHANIYIRPWMSLIWLGMFLTATGITNPTISSAVCTLVTSLKSASLWNKFNAIYPMVGGTATTHMYNLRNPANTNAYILSHFAPTVKK